MRVFILHSIFFTFCPFALLGGVAGNPFLRPTVVPPPAPAVLPPPPKPQVNPSLAKEVQFRGYFLFKGVPHFCIFNTKSNHGEWIKLNEKTYEEFEAHSFDLKAESLTLHFNGQEIILTLEESKVSKPENIQSSPIPRPNPASLSTVTSTLPSSVPQRMPPKPSVRPRIPDWLASRSMNRGTDTPSSFSTASRGGSFPLLPPRAMPPSPGSNLVQFPGSSGSSTGRVAPAINSSSPPVDAPQLSQVIDSTSIEPGGSESVDISSLDDLDSLPPPPPPPNILPPGPPPNILPSRDD